MSKNALKYKKNKRKSIDKALSVYLKKAKYILDRPSVEKVLYKLRLMKLRAAPVYQSEQALDDIMTEDKVLPRLSAPRGQIYSAVLFKFNEPRFAELVHHFRCGRLADIYFSREHTEANRAGRRAVSADHLEIVLLRRREPALSPVFASVEGKEFFAAVHTRSPFLKM